MPLKCESYQNYSNSLITGFSQAWAENPSSWATVCSFPFLLFRQQCQPHIDPLVPSQQAWRSVYTPLFIIREAVFVARCPILGLVPENDELKRVQPPQWSGQGSVGHRFSELGLLSPQSRKLKWDLTTDFNYVTRDYRKDRCSLPLEPHSNRVRAADRSCNMGNPI